MINGRFASVAALAAMALSVPAVRADDTTRLLAGSGSLQNPAGVATKTLKGGGATDADTVPVCCWWKRAWCCAPAVAYSAPAYYGPAYNPQPTVAPPPAPGPAAYYYGPTVPQIASAISTLGPTGRPAIVVSYQGRYFNGAVALRPGTRIAAPSQPSYYDYNQREMMPPPRPNDTFRYDGGPVRPVPMPLPDPVSPTDPVPNTVPALHRVMIQQSKPKAVNYPAYGERPTNRATIPEPLMVKRTGS
jgi:hypothetical protein